MFTKIGSHTSAIVKDSLLEVVIDSYGLINSMLLKWRPLTKSISTNLIQTHAVLSKLKNVGNEIQDGIFDFIFDNYATNNNAHDHNDEKETKKPTIEYKIAGDNSYQTHLMPFLVMPSGHHSQRIPIINHCIKISFIKIFSSNHTKIIANIEGGSGNYQYTWSCWEIANRKNYKELGHQNFCTVFGGAFHMLLTVTDIDFGITDQFQEFIYSSLPKRLQFKKLQNLIRQGCTNPKAINYNPKANCDDGSCLFNT